MKKIEISIKALLNEKISGRYGCPNYISPSSMSKLLDAKNISADHETILLLAEIAENFVIEMIEKYNTNIISKEDVKSMIQNIKII